MPRVRKEDNCVEVNLITGETVFGRLNLPKDRIEASAKILADILIDFVKRGGSVSDITPQNVFGRKADE